MERSSSVFGPARLALSISLAGGLVVGCSMAPAGSPTPDPNATPPPLLIDVNKLITWEIQPDELTGVMVIQQLKNIGEDWIQVAPRESTYEIKAPNGNVVAADNFRRAFPTYLAPGDTGYLIDEFIEGDAPIENITMLAVNARFRGMTGPPTRRLEARNVTLRSDELPCGFYVTGEALNVSDVEVASGQAAAVFFDVSGAIVGASTTDVLEHVAPGETVAFETNPGNPLDESAVSTFQVYVSPTL